MRKLIIACCAIVFVAVASSCKQGCTDEGAMNYNPDAATEDASCLYCDSSTVDQFSATDFASTINGFALQVVVTSVKKSYDGNGCRSIGLINEGACQNLRHKATFQNFTDSTVQFNGWVTVNYGFESFNHQFVNVVIPPRGTADVGDVGTMCIPGGGFFTFNIFLNNYFITFV